MDANIINYSRNAAAIPLGTIFKSNIEKLLTNLALITYYLFNLNQDY
jgi:hypothetical protein